MSRMRNTALGATAAILCSAAISAPAASADVIVPFNDFRVGGSLTVKKLSQSVDLPPGSTFNGRANLTTQRLRGNVFIPEFTSTLDILGVPTQVTTELEQVRPVMGTLAIGSTGTSIHATTSAILHLRKVRIGLLSVPTTCRTREPIVLSMDHEGPLTYPVPFDGTTTIPRLRGCGLLGPTLSALMSGPDNPYHLTLAPPPPAP